MAHSFVGVVTVVALAVLAGCGPGGGGDYSSQGARLPTRIPNEPAPAIINHPEELPPGWYIDPGHERGVMLFNTDPEDNWVWIAIDWSVVGPDLQSALEIHHRVFEEDPNGEYLGNGEVVTARFGEAVWSWGRSGEDEETTKDELTLFVIHPYRPATLAFRYLTPPTDEEISVRIEELLAIAAVVDPVE